MYLNWNMVSSASIPFNFSIDKKMISASNERRLKTRAHSILSPDCRRKITEDTLNTDLPLIPIFQYKSRSIPIYRFHVWKSRVFISFWNWKKQKGVSLCCMARVSKPTKFGLKINAVIGWILCTPRLSEWSRLGLASLSCRPELSLTWCHSSADPIPRNSAGFEGSSHLSSIPPIFPPFATIWAAETGKVQSPK